MKKTNSLKVFGLITAVFVVAIMIGYGIQQGYFGVGDSVSGLATNVSELFQTHDENQLLRDQMFNEQTVSLRIEQLEVENESLRIALETGNDLTGNGFDIMYAATIQRKWEHWNDFIIINKGSEHGVEEDMTVLSKEGYLIGRVTKVDENTSRVQLINYQNTTMKVPSIVEGVEDSTGILEGYDFSTGELVVVSVERDIEIAEGDKVITSGLGGVSPRGLLIGYVERTEISADMLTQTLTLSSGTDYNNLDFVILIK